MYITYLDESGCTGVLPAATSAIQPVLSILAISIRADKVPLLTRDFVTLKRRFFPVTAVPTFLNSILEEIKGADFRRDIRNGDRDKTRHHLLFLGQLLRLLEQYEAILFGRIYIKLIGGRFEGMPVYSSAVQSLCYVFQHFLSVKNDDGIIIADSRYPGLNAQVSHSIFTQKFRVQGDKYPNMQELPLFGHSENHAGIQICDLINSGILFPLACHVYCTGHVTSVHVHPAFAILKQWFGQRIRNLQYRFEDPLDNNRWKGGLTVTDALSHRSAADLF